MRLVTLSLLAALAGCSSGSGPASQQAPDFALLDVNPTSTSFDQPVSPRDHIGRTSAWYFGAAT